jgi:hypothetical protein
MICTRIPNTTAGVTVDSIAGDDIRVVYMYSGKPKYEVFKRHVLRKIPDEDDEGDA